MIITYWIIVSFILVFFLTYILSRYNIILKNTKIGDFMRSSFLKYLIKRILFSALILFSVITFVFLLIRILPKDYFYQFNEIDIKDANYYSNKISDDNFFKQLLDFYYNILPFPKKICTSTYLDSTGTLACSTYEYKIINFGYSYTYMKGIRVWEIIKEKSGVSLLIGGLAYLLQCLIGYPLGIYIARKENKTTD